MNCNTFYNEPVTDTPLRAPMEIAFDYTRSLGPVLGQFMTALRERRVLGARGADGTRARAAVRVRPGDVTCRRRNWSRSGRPGPC